MLNRNSLLLRLTDPITKYKPKWEQYSTSCWCMYHQDVYRRYF